MNRIQSASIKLRPGLALLLGSALLAGCGDRVPEQQAAEPVLAVIGDEVITVAEFEDEMRLRPGYYRETEHRRQLLDQMIRRRALVAEARRQGIDRMPEMRRMIERLLVQRLHETQIDAEIAEAAVSDQEVFDFYQAHQDEFARPARIQGAIIHVAAAAGSEESVRAEKRARIEDALQEAEDLPDEVLHFGQVALEYSDDRASRYQGGVVGWLVNRPGHTYRWDAAVVDGLFALEAPGDIGPVIETDDGFYLIRLVAREDAQTRPLEQVADGIRHRLLRERRAAIGDDLLDALVARHETNIDHAVLGGIAPPVPDAAPAREPPSRQPPGLPGQSPGRDADDKAKQMETEE